ncbi:MAG: hypothetical protein IPQ05_03290 [Leptospiraceae bacterium]|nr:hypothetical protein [Leptospiraceae bacterium]MBK9499154.1 hypothetical protein [Leptospiraceae bacterium]MBL0262904.1 hypothetical protein [Leptospiraceae bacterium]
MNEITDPIIQKFEEIWFHDIEVTTLSHDFKKSEIKIGFNEWDEIKEDKSPITVTFLGVTKFVSKYPDEALEFDIWGCHDGQIKKLDSCYEIYYLFEIDGSFAYQIFIHCKSLEIERALSPSP